MLMDINAVVAARCPWCGYMKVSSISPFDVSGSEGVVVDCKCGEELFTISREKSGRYSLKVSCIACDNKHIYKLGYKELWKQKVHVLSCYYTGVEICFIGNETHVMQTVKRYEEELDELISELGFEEFLEDEDLFPEDFGEITNILDKINFNGDYGKSKIEKIFKGPKQSK